jgi:beta-lactamase regulating signal transducer with metallopeptidase domain
MIQAICWVLIHSLWQGAVLAVAAGCILAGTRRSAAAVRYRLLGGLLFLFLAVCGLTFLYELYLAGEIGGVGEPGNVAVADALAAGSGILRRYCEANAEWIVCAWFVVAAVKAVRMAGGWGYVHAISRHGHTEAPEQWVRLVARWAAALGIRRRVRLLESRLVQAPMIVGHLKPVIFIPLGLINQLPPDEIESVLLHELAHIRRHDYLVNLMQQLSECVFFFNPGLLWVSSLLREERENCCDDIAIAQTGDRVGLVRALVRIKEHSMGVAVVAFRPGGKRQLLRRVLRIAQQRNQGLNGGERFFLSASFMVVLLLFLSVHRVGGGVIAESQMAAHRQAMDSTPTAIIAGATVPGPELIAVLREQQRVAQNMEWVEQQLTTLHQHKVKTGQGPKRRTGGKGAQVRLNPLQVQQDMEQEKRNKEQDEKNRLQVQRNREQDEQNQAQAERERMQVERDREQALRDHAQAELDRLQADRDRAQAERDRQQAEKDREQANRDRQQAELERQQADRQRSSKTTTTVTTTVTTQKE